MTTLELEGAEDSSEKNEVVQSLKRIQEVLLVNPSASIALLRELEVLAATDLNFVYNAGGILIDAGTALSDTSIIEEGITRTRYALVIFGGEVKFKGKLHYDLANGLLEIEKRAYMSERVKYNPFNDTLTEAKRTYLTSLAELSDSIPDVYVNYANCLSQFGRSLDAIDQYKAALSVDPHHPMALWNLAVELRHFAKLSQDGKLFVNAWRLVEQSLEGQRLEHYGYGEWRPQIEHLFAELSPLASEMDMQMGIADESDLYSTPYLSYIHENELFLSLNLSSNVAFPTASDDISPVLAGSVDLTELINEIKERYSYARVQMFRVHTHYSYGEFDDAVNYDSAEESELHSSETASLKTIVETCFLILDKLSQFVNQAFGFGRPVERVSYANLWKDSNGQYDTLLQAGNWFLYAMCDLGRDLAKDGSEGILKELRNYIVHRHVRVYGYATASNIRVDEHTITLSFEQLEECALQCLKLTRKATLYVVLATIFREWINNLDAPLRYYIPPRNW